MKTSELNDSLDIIDENIYQLNDKEGKIIQKSQKKIEKNQGIDSEDVSDILKRFL